MGRLTVFRKPVPLSEAHKLELFDSGKPALDYFLTHVALRSQQDGHARTFVITDEEENVVGYHALCGGMLDRENAPRQVGGHGAPREIPVALLARLAVDRRHQGRQLGTVLMRHAFASVVAASSFVGFRAIMVHALDDEAAAFYAKFGFRAAKGLERTLLLSLNDITRILALTRSQS